MFYAVIHDTWEPCPGHTKLGPFETKEAALDRINKELTLIDKSFVDGRVGFWTEVIEA